MIELDKVYNCNCIDLMEKMIEQDIKVDMLLTDIPYGEVNRADSGLRKLDKGNADLETFNLEKFLPIAEKCFTGTAIIFCGMEQLSLIRNFFNSINCTIRLLIWKKSNPSPMNGEFVYLSGVEIALWIKKPKATFNAFCKNTIFTYPSGKNDIHNTQKPLSLWYELINDNTNERDIVLDTCMGSFTTAIACHKLGRHYIGAELDKDYFRLGTERLEAVKNQTSMFDEI